MNMCRSSLYDDGVICFFMVILIVSLQQDGTALASTAVCSGTQCDSCSACLTQQDPGYGWCGNYPYVGYCMPGNVNEPSHSKCFFSWSFNLCPPYPFATAISIVEESDKANSYLPCFHQTSCIVDKEVKPQNLLESGRTTVYQYHHQIDHGYGIRIAIINLKAAVCVGSVLPVPINMSYEVQGGATLYQPIPSAPSNSCLSDTPYQMQFLPLVSNLWWTNYPYLPSTNTLKIKNLNDAGDMSAVAIVSMNLQFQLAQIDPLIEILPQIGAYCDENSNTLCVSELVFHGTNLLKLNYFCNYTANILPSVKASSSVVVHNNVTASCTIPYSNTDLIPTPSLGSPTSVIYQFTTDGWASTITILQLYSTPAVYNITPIDGSLLAFTTVTLLGAGFFNSPKISVNFAGLNINVQTVSNTSVTFVIPPSVNQTKGGCVSITLDGIIYFPSSERCIEFRYTGGNIVVPNPAPSTTPPVASPTILNDWVFYAACGAILVVVILVVVIYCKTNSERKRNKYTRLNDVADEDKALVRKAEIKPDEIEFGDVVGSGSFSIVYVGKWQDIKVAIKVIKASEPREDLLVEAAIMVKLEHPNIVKFMGACLDPAPNLFIVTEYLPNGSLSKLLGNKMYKIDSEHARKWAADTCRGMAYLHNCNIIHRDLKPANLLVTDDWSIKVADFGLSRVLHNAQVTQTLTACGTISCSAPEVLRDQRYSLRADVYSFGVCLWAMFTRKKPYPKKTDAQIVIAVAIEGKRLPIPPKMPKEITKLLKMCWQTDPKQRPTFTFLADAFEAMTLPAPPYPFPVLMTEATIDEKSYPSPSTSVNSTPTSGEAQVIGTTILNETAKLLD